MYEPLRALFDGDASAAPVSRVLGEKGGVLFAADAYDAYVASGGAAYAACRCANVDVARADATRRAAAAHVTSCRRRDDRTTATTRLRSLTRRGVAALWRAAWQPRRTLHNVLLCPLASVLPVLRVVVPTAVPSYKQQLQQLSCSSSSLWRGERVCAVAWHPTRPLLAVAIDEGVAGGDARVCVYHVTQRNNDDNDDDDDDANTAWRTPVCVLTHAFQRHVCALAWKPRARAVLAVGCHAGVLLWYVTATTTMTNTVDEAADDEAMLASVRRRGGACDESTAWSLFYPCARAARVTSLAFTHRDGRYVACGSVDTTRVYVLDVRLPPHDAAHIACCVAPSLDGGSALVCFSDDDAVLLTAVCAHATLTLTRLRASELGSEVVGVAAPVTQLVRARGVGVDYYFVAMRGVAGVALARVRPRSGVVVVCAVSTSPCRGVGGDVCALACSGRRLWVSMSSGHVLWCYYKAHEQQQQQPQQTSSTSLRRRRHDAACDDNDDAVVRAVSLLPIGVAAVVATQLYSCSSNDAAAACGSLLALVERDETLHLLPAYHA